MSATELQDYVDKLKISSNSQEEEEKIKEIVSRIKEHDVYTFDGKGRSLWATEIGVELIRRAIGYRIEQDEDWKNKEFSEIKNIVEYNPLIYKNKKILGFLTSGSGTTPAVVDSADLLKSISPESYLVAFTCNTQKGISERAQTVIELPKRQETEKVSITDPIMGDMNEEATLLSLYCIAKSIYENKPYSPEDARREMKEWMKNQGKGGFLYLRKIIKSYLDSGSGIDHVGHGLSDKISMFLANRLKLLSENPETVQVSSEASARPVTNKDLIIYFSASANKSGKDIADTSKKTSSELGVYDPVSGEFCSTGGYIRMAPVISIVGKIRNGKETSWLESSPEKGINYVVMTSGEDSQSNRGINLFYVLAPVVFDAIYRDIADEKNLSHTVLKERHNNVEI